MPTNTFALCERRQALRLFGAATLAASLTRVALAAAAPVKIGTIGAGNMGSYFGDLWIKKGHDVMFSSRHPESLKSLADKLGPKAHVGTVAEAIAYADVILLAIPYTSMPDFCKENGKALVAKACVIDATNAREYREKEFATEVLKVGIADYTAKLLPGAKVVRAFNNQGGIDKLKDGGARRLGMPFSGTDKGAIAVASDLIRETGFEPVLIGGNDMGNYLVPDTALAGQHTPEEIKKIVATLKVKK